MAERKVTQEIANIEYRSTLPTSRLVTQEVANIEYVSTLATSRVVTQEVVMVEYSFTPLYRPLIRIQSVQRSSIW